MGRYTTVQSFADNSLHVALPYEKASGGIKADPDSRAPGVRVPVVQNVSGSTAGAGSSHFHVYRLERRREEERVKNMDESHVSMIRNQEYHARLEQNRLDGEAKTRKKAEKRKRAKSSKGLKKHETTALEGVALGEDSGEISDGLGNEDDVYECSGASNVPSAMSAILVGDGYAGGEDLLLDDGKFMERFMQKRIAAETTESVSMPENTSFIPSTLPSSVLSSSHESAAVSTSTGSASSIAIIMGDVQPKTSVS